MGLQSEGEKADLRQILTYVIPATVVRNVSSDWSWDWENSEVKTDMALT